jgi:lysophospholipase L1-like esterase
VRKTFWSLGVLAVAAATAAFVTANPATGNSKAEWTGTWATALSTANPNDLGGSLSGFNNQSIRMIVRTSVGGEKLRIRVSNAYGTQPLAVGHASVGVPVGSALADLVPGSVKELTFGGSESVTVYKGAEAVSDPIDFDVAPLSELAVTVFLPGATGPTSWHWTARQRTFIYPGDQAENASGANPSSTISCFYFLAAVDVAGKPNGGSVVVLGDSISDGFNTTFNANHRWPDRLAERIIGTPPGVSDPGVLNESLSGNEVTHDGADINFPPAGLSGLARMDHDVLGQTGVHTVIIELGINDIHFLNEPSGRVITGLRQLVSQLQERELQVLICTITPFEGYPTWTAGKETTRQEVNAFIRSGFEHVVDIDQALRDPAAPTKLRADLDSGDHLHPNDAGAAVIAGAVPLWLL